MVKILYRQYARLTMDYVQNIRDNDKGCYSDDVSYADTIKVDVLKMSIHMRY